MHRRWSARKVLERFAPRFRGLVFACDVIPAVGLPDHNTNYVGGDTAGGARSL